MVSVVIPNYNKFNNINETIISVEKSNITVEVEAINS